MSNPWLNHYPPGLDWAVAIPRRPLCALLDEAASLYPRHVALDFLGRKTTYEELAAQVNHLAAGLQSIGVGRGVQVGLFMPNCPQFVASYYAILKAGGTVVNYNPLYSVPEIRHQINDSATELLITLNLKAIYPKTAECLDGTTLRTIVVADFPDALPLHKKLAFTTLRKAELVHPPTDNRHVSWASLMESGHRLHIPDIHPDSDVAVLQYTGGTTGVPKGAILTHANLYANAVQCGLWFTGLARGAEIVMGALPLFHVFAMTAVMNLSIHTGSHLILHPRFDLKSILQDIQAKKPTLMAGVPTMFAAMNNHPSTGKYDLTSLKMGISGGGPLPEEVKRRFESLTGCKLVEGYGLSEASPVVAANPLFGQNKTGSIGLPLPATTIEIIDPEHADKAMGVGEIGEICVRGPQVMRGYLHHLSETRNVLKNGRLHTGDLGYMDAEGYFFVADRIKEMIISGGYKIYPRNIEEVLYRHPAVLEAAVVGIPHPQRVQVPKAYVVLKPGQTATELELRDHLKANIAAYAMPHAYEFRESLPKSMIGKILKKELLAEEGRGRG